MFWRFCRIQRGGERKLRAPDDDVDLVTARDFISVFTRRKGAKVNGKSGETASSTKLDILLKRKVRLDEVVKL